MNLGWLFLLVSFFCFFLAAIGVKAVPMLDTWAHASLVLGILLAGVPVGPWWRPGP